jgi:hypothetical protein
MPAASDFLTLAQICYAQAGSTLDPDAKDGFPDLGDKCVKEAERLRGSENVTGHSSLRRKKSPLPRVINSRAVTLAQTVRGDAGAR